MKLHRIGVAILIVILSVTLAGALAELPSVEQRTSTSQLTRRVIDGGLQDTGALNLVSAVLFDYRAFDTLGEATVIFAAVAGVVMLFYQAPLHPSSIGLSMLAKRSLDSIGPFVFLAGMYVVLYGHISPGGGFQGGVILATLTILISIVYGLETERRLLDPTFKTTLESSAALLFMVIAFGGVLTGEYFLSNLSAGFPRGEAGSLLSAGSLAPLNAAIGLKVGAGLALIFYSMVKREPE